MYINYSHRHGPPFIPPTIQITPIYLKNTNNLSPPKLIIKGTFNCYLEMSRYLR